MASKAWMVVALGCVGCPSPSQVEPVEPVAVEAVEVVEPVKPVEPVEPDEPIEPDEPVEIQYTDAPFAADLDGDGEREPIGWDCNDPATIRVRDARVERALGQTEVISCAVAIVELSSATLLLYTSWDHDEVGPPTHVLYRYAKGALVEQWTSVGQLEWLADGSWRTTHSTCFDTYVEIEVATHRWDGAQVIGETKIEKTPNEYGCAEP